MSAIEPIQSNNLCTAFRSGKQLQRAWLQSRLRRNELSHAELARQLAVHAPQVANWLNDSESIPAAYRLRLAEILGLSALEVVELNQVAETSARLRELQRLFEARPGSMQPSKVSRPNLGAWFQHPEAIFQRLHRYAAEHIEMDSLTMTSATVAQLMYVHVDAAYRSSRELGSYLANPSSTLFDERNIWIHLRFPHHLYVAFFLTQVSRQDGPEVAQLQLQIQRGLEACLSLLRSSHGPQVRAAQHALHLLSRYRGATVRSHFGSGDPETRRMAYFGEVYRRFDDGPFEELSTLILDDERFAAATLAFDALHYRDYQAASATAVVPINALSRLLSDLADARPSLRRLSCARVWNVLRRLDTNAASNTALLSCIADKRELIELFRPDGRLETQVHEVLLALIRLQHGRDDP
jgi:plasmid maintenance system antidote protein VapI